MQSEDDILNRVSVEALLAKLRPEYAEMLVLIYRLEHLADYTGTWPPTYDAIGHYIGTKFGKDHRPLSEAAIRYRRDAALAFLRGDRTEL